MKAIDEIKKIALAVGLFISVVVSAACSKSETPSEPKATLPTITTSVAASITQTTAASGGIITADGGSAITARGVCWGTSSNPTIEDGKTSDGSGTGSFTSNIAGLTANTTYYARAYATNSAGTGYGAEISFKTKESILTNLAGAYLGQTLPGNTPIKFLPTDNNFQHSANTWWWHGTPVFSPDGNQMLFVKYFANQSGPEIWMTEVSDGKWTIPVKAPFIPGKANHPVFVSKDTLVYMAITVVANPNKSNTGTIYKITRTAGVWGTPQKINIPIPANYEIGGEFTISKSKNIYLYLIDSNGSCDIFISKYVNEQYQLAEKIDELNSPQYDGADYIDPDEKFMLISSGRRGGNGALDIYISRKKADGKWDTPKNPGPSINTSSSDFFAQISTDGKYLFYISITQQNGAMLMTPFWVDAKILD